MNIKIADDIIAAKQYPHNKISNLDPENRLPSEKRNAVRREIEPALNSIRTELASQSRRILLAFNRDRKQFKMKFPKDDLDFSVAGYGALEDAVQETFIQTKDLEDLIDFGAPVLFVLSRLERIIDNIRFTNAELGKALKKMEWRELERAATYIRDMRIPFAERKGNAKTNHR